MRSKNPESLFLAYRQNHSSDSTGNHISKIDAHTEHETDIEMGRE